MAVASKNVMIAYLLDEEEERIKTRSTRSIWTRPCYGVCSAIVEALGKDHFKKPETTEEWMEIAEKYYRRWNFPNGLGGESTLFCSNPRTLARIIESTKEVILSFNGNDWTSTSRMRRISENEFGILANRWRVFRRPFSLGPEKVKNITIAAITLHNWLRKDSTYGKVYIPKDFVDHEDVITEETRDSMSN
eukprot:gene3496-1879_t